MKVIAMYLPQFYRTKENDEWWGEGYTDWEAAKKADKLFEEHYEPRIPLNNNYYNLLDKKIMIWQAELMSKYNIYGMCFYHYWFKDGRQVLEKPAENLLKWKNVNMPFCFSWANETWARSWSNISEKNTWFTQKNARTTEKINADKGILLEQSYGSKEDWIGHFMYLLPFFKDKRYIKKDGKPVFIIYKPHLISCFQHMRDTWNKLAKDNDLDGIYFMATNESNCELYDAVILQQPGNVISKYYTESTYSEKYPVKKCIDYEKMWQHIINTDYSAYRNVYVGGFVGYDDTPRRGNNGVSIINSSPEIFEKYLKKLLKLNESNGADIVFINAWNEWGEGMYLEPDEKYGYRYLEAVKNALDKYQEVEVDYKPEIINQQTIIDRYKSYWTIMDKWLSLKEEHKSLDLFFRKHNMMNIAVYGMGMLGRHLIKELENSPVNIVYGIDRFNVDGRGDFPIYKTDEKLPQADAIIVTVTYDFDNIYRDLSNKGIDKIISLDIVVEELIYM